MGTDWLNRRSEPRVRTRLRSGKLLDRDKIFLTDCSIFDRSTHGARLRLFANVDLPERFRLYDEASKQLFDAKVAWRRGQDVGVRLLGAFDRFLVTA
ncbi:MAG: PilZ domain-containing protein [Roseiarcus sp.]|jgi:hypothetical protein